MKKILFFMTLSVSFLFSAINLQTASKNELMCIKGIGVKKAEAIILYRKSNKLNSPADLLKIKGFGKGLIEKVKKGEKTAKCSGKRAKVEKAPVKKSKVETNKKEEKKTLTKINK
jgi:competence protein ComEA